MKILKSFLAASVLALCLCSAAFADDFCPGEMQAPGRCLAANISDSDSATQSIEVISSDQSASDVIADSTISLVELWLSLY